MNTQRGFTLLEVIVSFTVLALTLGSVLQAVQGALRAAATASAYGAARQIAENRLARAMRTGELQPGTALGGQEGQYAWRLSVSAQPEADGDAPLAPYALRVEVRWDTGRHERALVLSTWRLLPAQGTRGGDW